MKKATFISMLISSSLMLASCSVIGGIFKAGVWTGIFIIAVVVLVIIFLLTKVFKK